MIKINYFWRCALILAIDFKEVTKTSFVSKLKAHQEPEITTHCHLLWQSTGNVGHLKKKVRLQTPTHGR
ncbi:hypothetical protein F6P94_22865 [Escherichia coli]|nr:hypothetical protein F6P94_22865 [Escherichia coli]